jgi:hypothetical protein
MTALSERALFNAVLRLRREINAAEAVYFYAEDETEEERALLRRPRLERLLRLHRALWAGRKLLRFAGIPVAHGTRDMDLAALFVEYGALPAEALQPVAPQPLIFFPAN